MNIALSTFVLFLLILPGLTFRRFYYTEEFSKEYFKASFGEMFTSTIIPTIVIHAFCLWCFVYPKYQVDFDVLGTLLGGSEGQEKYTEAFNNIDQFKVEIFWYFVLVGVISMISGLVFKFIVRKLKLDRKVKLFRFQNEWHYLFSGEIYDFERIDGEHQPIHVKYIDALVDTSDGPMIYMGILADYVLSKNGGIDRIYLTEVTRRLLQKDNPGDEDNSENHYDMPGDFFVIPFDQILNLHILYYRIAVSEILARDISLSGELDFD